MKKILFLSRSSDDLGLYRRDLNVILNELVDKGNNVEIYDVKKSQLIKVIPKKIQYYGIIPPKYKISKNKFVIFFNLFLFLIKNQNKYDIVQINYVREEYLVLSPLVKKLGKKLFILVYGSDINSPSRIKNYFKSLYKATDKILFTNPVLLEKFYNRYERLHIKSKLEKISLPFTHFKYYNNFTLKEKSNSKLELNLNPTKTTISVGTAFYNNEQHELVIEQLQNLNNPNAYTLIFNLTGFITENTSRVLELEELIKKSFSNFDYRILKGNLSDKEIANYRFASDIFINLRKMDQLVLSMLESNLAYSYVITGEWLPYQDYTANTNTFVISEFNELNNAIEKITNIPQEQKEIQLKENKNYIEKNFNENEAIKYWLSIFE